MKCKNCGHELYYEEQTKEWLPKFGVKQGNVVLCAINVCKSAARHSSCNCFKHEPSNTFN